MANVTEKVSADAAEARTLLQRLEGAVEDDFKAIVSKLHGLINRLEGNVKQHVETNPPAPAAPAPAAAAPAPATPAGTAPAS